MALEIVWTRWTQTGYEAVIEYPEKHSTENEIRELIRRTQEFFELLNQYPEMLRRTNKQKQSTLSQSTSLPS